MQIYLATIISPNIVLIVDICSSGQQKRARLSLLREKERDVYRMDSLTRIVKRVEREMRL